MASARVTVTLPTDVVDDIDRFEKNRSKFVLDAVRQELIRRRREELGRSLASPHEETERAVVVEEGFDAWASSIVDADTEGLVDPDAGRPIRWVQGEGWTEGER